MLDTLPRYLGWFRVPGQPWEPVCQAADADDCRRLLDAHRAERGERQVDLAVLRWPTHPADKVGEEGRTLGRGRGGRAKPR